MASSLQGSLVIRISGDATGYEKALKEVGKQTADLERNLAKVAKISGVAFAALTGSVALAVNEFAKFDDQITGVKTLLDETSFGAKGLEKGFADMRKETLALQARVPQSIESVNKSLFDMVSAGVDAEKAVAAVGVASKLATAGLTDITIATDGITSALNAYGISADQADLVASKFFAAQKKGKTTIEELASGFGLVAATAANTGVAFNEVLAAVSAATLGGIKTSQAYTSLNAVISGIAKPTSDAAKEAKRLGIDFSLTALKAKGLSGFLKELTDAQGFNTDSVTKLFGSVEAMKVIFALTGGQAEDFKEILNDLNDDTKTATLFNDAFEAQNSTLAKQMETTGKAIQVAAIAFGEHFAPAVATANEALGSIFRFFAEHETLSGFAAAVTAIGIALTGLAFAFSVAAIGALKFRAAMIASSLTFPLVAKGIKLFQASLALAGRTIKFFAFTIRGALIASGIGLLIVAVGLLVEHWDAVWPRMLATFKSFAAGWSKIALGIGDLLTAVVTLDGDKILSGFNLLSTALSTTARVAKEEFGKINLAEEMRARLPEVEELGKEIANKAFVEPTANALETRSDMIARVQGEELEQKKVALNTILEADAEFLALSAEQQAVFREEEAEKLQAAMITSEEARRISLSSTLKSEIDHQNKTLIATEKFGKAYGAIYKFIYSSRMKGAMQASGDLVALQSSENATLKTIGRAAAIFQISIKTAESAMNIYAGFSTIPIIGPALGVAGALAAVAFGAEQIGKVTGAAQGGLAEGGIPGVDSLPFMLQRGELVTPRRNADEVVSDAADRKLRDQGLGGGAGGLTEVIIGFKDEAFEIIEEKILERRAVGTGSI